MSCRSMPRYAMLVQPFLTRPCNFHLNINQHHIQPPRHYNCNKNLTPIAIAIAIGPREFHHPKPPLPCSRNETTPSHNDQDPTQQAVLKAISGRNGNHLVFGNYVSAGFVTEASKTEGRVGQTTNMVIGDTVADDSTSEWLALDQKVNSYPTVRGFTAIGTGGDDFVQAMVVAVESVIQQPIPQGCVKQKSSSGGKYVSVNIGPIQVVSSEQVFSAVPTPLSLTVKNIFLAYFCWGGWWDMLRFYLHLLDIMSLVEFLCNQDWVNIS